ncbi:MAG: N-6 DNA methylase [Chloroflexi bacterium]|nr:N-6 DNA methylase [Chloroflexota bacterium]
MPQRIPDFTAALEAYLRHLAADRPSAVAETSRYGYLQMLFNAAGEQLAAPRVHAVIHPANSGAGIPDLGLYAADQPDDARPQHGVVEAKPTSADVRAIAHSQQVRGYLLHYRLVLVTNYYCFLLVTLGDDGQPRLEEEYRLAESEAAFWQAAQNPRLLAQSHAPALLEYLMRVMRRHAPLRTPQEVAAILASYAREARARLESDAIHQPTLQRIRTQLEEALGIHFREEQGEAFFRSSLVQTLFYGLFSAWVLWREENPSRTDAFDLWRHTRHLNVPAVRLLFEQFTAPSRLNPLKIEEVLLWTAAALNRVERGAFFAVFGRVGDESGDGETANAVQYFYEPFLQAFDPELRRQLGVWYTPPEVVDYMTARVDRALREELGIADGLADPRVTVLDPCCGTGAYLVSVMRLIYRRLSQRNGPALAGQQTAEAVRTRLFGFEILPAPFVVAHLQIGMLLAGEMRAPLRTDQRAGVYLTNALTGWDPDIQPTLSQNILAQEYEAALGVKQESQILVVLGNPPYSGYAGLAMDEERGLVDAYRRTEQAPPPQGQGLNDLYVRFFRMAERRIVEMTGRGVVCFISNYSWLDGLSHTGMRERYLAAFDSVTIDSLNGDKYRTGKTTPEGRPDPSIFSTPFNREGIQVGTAIATLVRSGNRTDVNRALYRELWGVGKLAQLRQESEEGGSAQQYTLLQPNVELGYPLVPRILAADYLSWPKLPELFPQSFPGVKTSRDAGLVEIDRQRLEERMAQYFNPAISHAEMTRFAPELVTSTATYNAEAVRNENLRRGRSGEIVRYCYRPFDVRWLFWQGNTGLLDRAREDYFPHIHDENIWLEARQRIPTQEFDRGMVVRMLADNLGNGLSSYFPLYLYDDDPGQLFQARHENLSPAARRYLERVGGDGPALFYHALAVLHAPAYRLENSGGLRQDWPRLPLPAEGDALAASAALGRTVAALLDPEQPVNGVTRGDHRPDLRSVAVFDFAGNQPDLAVSAGWGYGGRGGVVMPARGRVEERLDAAGEPVLDVYLNDSACWRGVPAAVWEYTLGGYPVLKKWLSYREAALLGRPLHLAEVETFTHSARRIAALLALADELDANYRRAASMRRGS